MLRRNAGGFSPTAQWRVVTIDNNDGSGFTAGAPDEATARKHYTWLTQTPTDRVVILEARAAEGDDWITIERHP